MILIQAMRVLKLGTKSNQLQPKRIEADLRLLDLLNLLVPALACGARVLISHPKYQIVRRSLARIQGNQP